MWNLMGRWLALSSSVREVRLTGPQGLLLTWITVLEQTELIIFHIHTDSPAEESQRGGWPVHQAID